MDDIKELIEAIKNGNSYDFIANNYWKMSKEQLKDALLEYIYLAHDNKIDESSVADCLEERYN